MHIISHTKNFSCSFHTHTHTSSFIISNYRMPHIEWIYLCIWSSTCNGLHLKYIDGKNNLNGKISLGVRGGILEGKEVWCFKDFGAFCLLCVLVIPNNSLGTNMNTILSFRDANRAILSCSLQKAHCHDQRRFQRLPVAGLCPILAETTFDCASCYCGYVRVSFYCCGKEIRLFQGALFQ